VIDQVSRDLQASPDRFDYEWDAYAEMLPECEERFRRWTVYLAPQDWWGRSFLDVGCGMGGNSFSPMSYGAREGVAADINERSLAAARRNLAGFRGVEVVQSSAYDLDFADRFDIAFAIGVIPSRIRRGPCKRWSAPSSPEAGC
jgi:SAM-dependent methyltransferase